MNEFARVKKSYIHQILICQMSISASSQCKDIDFLLLVKFINCEFIKFSFRQYFQLYVAYISPTYPRYSCLGLISYRIKMLFNFMKDKYLLFNKLIYTSHGQFSQH